MKTVYLCGGINGLTDSQCNDWRNHASERLENDFKILNPMRRDYRGKEDESVTEIVEGDYVDIDDSDILLVNAASPSWGTGMEIHQAWQRGKTVATVCPAPRISPWLRYHSTKMFTDLDAAISYIQGLS